MQLPPELLKQDTQREAPQHYEMDLYRPQTHTHSSSSIPRHRAACSRADNPFSNPGDKPDTEGAADSKHKVGDT